MKLVPDYRQAHRWWSVRVAALLAVADVLADHFPLIEQYLGGNYARYAAIAIIVARILAQADHSGNPDRSAGRGVDDPHGA